VITNHIYHVYGQSAKQEIETIAFYYLRSE
jgi:hypothetical protein